MVLVREKTKNSYISFCLEQFSIKLVSQLIKFLWLKLAMENVPQMLQKTIIFDLKEEEKTLNIFKKMTEKCIAPVICADF